MYLAQWDVAPFLSPWKDEKGHYKFDGRFNMGVVSLNFTTNWYFSSW